MLSFLFILNVLCALYIIFFERKHYAAAWAWVIVILFLPYVGFILYLFMGLPIRTRKHFNNHKETQRFMKLLRNQLLDLDYQKNAFMPWLTKDYSSLIKLHLKSNESPYTDQNKANVFTDGILLFHELFETLKNATTSIHLEYYIIRNDSVGKTLQSILIDKAKEGVEVLILYDGMGCLHVPKSYFKELKASGCKTACFFPPFLPYINWRVNYRNHRKICVVDGKTAFIGGFNIGKEYVGLNPEMGYWRDTHLKLVGSVVSFLDLQFLVDWRFITKEHLPLENYIPSYTESSQTFNPYLDPTIGIQIVASGPDSLEQGIRNGYIKMINEAKKSIQIQTPYFIPDEALFTALKIAALSGVKISIMIPNKPDHMFVYWATYAYIGELLAVGAECFIYDKGFLHAKTLIIDEKICSVGTANFDIRSLKLNFEVNAFIYDAAFATKLSETFREDIKHCHQLTFDLYCSRNILIKAKESIARLLAPIL